MERVVFRNSLRHLVGTWILRAPPVVLVVSALDRYADLLPWWWFEIFLAVFIIVTIPVLLEPVWAARFRTLTIAGDVLTLRSGWFAPETRTTTRAQITSVQIDEPMSQRLSGVRAVTILTSGVTSSALSMPALRPEQALALERVLGQEQSPGADLTGSARADLPVVEAPTDPNTLGSARFVQGAEPASLLYEANARDIVATSLSGGYILVLAAAAIGATQNVSTLFTFTVAPISWADPGVLLLAISFIALTLMALIAGRFKGFRIERTNLAQTRISYGVVERTAHTISSGQVVAVTLVRTPVDLILGTTRLVLSTAWVTDGGRKRLVFPSMPRAMAAHVVAETLGRQIPELLFERRRWWAAGPAPILASVAVVAVGGPVLSTWAVAIVAGGILGLGLTVLRYALSKLSVTASHDIVGHTLDLSHRVTVYFPGAVRSVLERRVPGLPVGNVTVLGWAHRRFVHRVPVRSATVSAEVRSALWASTAPAETAMSPTSPLRGGVP